MLFINRKGSLNYLFSITKLKLSVELSVKLIESDPFGKNTGFEGKSKGYFVIDLNGCVKPIKIKKEEEQSVKFTTGFFRLNINALKKLL